MNHEASMNYDNGTFAAMSYSNSGAAQQNCGNQAVTF
jgi:hypothetical protein